MSRSTNSRGASALLSILAVLLVAGFLYWLSLRGAAIQTEVQPVTEEEAAGEMVDIIPAQLAGSPESLIGQAGILREVNVVQTLGRGLITVDLDGTDPYPVLLSPDVISRGTSVSDGARITVYGNVYALNDSIRSVWRQEGAVESGNAEAVPATSSFMLADSLTLN